MLGNKNAVCLETELGHVSLPDSVKNILQNRFQENAGQFISVEHCFSGRGLSSIHSLVTDQAPIDAADIVAKFAATNDPDTIETLALFAHLLGTLTRELILQRLPLNGLYFAGSVARGLFDTGHGPLFASSLKAEKNFSTQLRDIPVSVIKNDAAALLGCIAATRL